MFCKKSVKDNDVGTHTLSSGEVLCEPCLQGIREYKRTKRVWFLATDGMQPTAKRVIRDHWNGMVAELQQIHGEEFPHLETIQANAEHHETQSESDDRGTERRD